MKKLSVLFLAVILIVISTLCIIIRGNTYTIKFKNVKAINSIDELNIKIENEVVKCIDQKLENGTLELKLQSISKGKTYIDLYNENEIFETFPIYVHNFGVITVNSFFGNSRSSIIIPISISIWLTYIIILLIKKYKNELSKNMYQYKNIANLGVIIF